MNDPQWATAKSEGLAPTTEELTIRGPAGWRWLNIGCYFAFLAAQIWLLVVSLTLEPTNPLLILIALWTSAGGACLLLRAFRACIRATEAGVQLSGVLRTYRFGWSEVVGFEVWDWRGAPSLWVELVNGNPPRQVCPFVAQGPRGRTVPYHELESREALRGFQLRLNDRKART